MTLAVTWKSSGFAACAPPASASSTPADRPEKNLDTTHEVLLVVSSGDTHSRDSPEVRLNPVVTPFALFMSINECGEAVARGP